ncbi:hypothetical protein Ancab_004140, partial [Ancistrocladus abbreviatus]
ECLEASKGTQKCLEGTEATLKGHNKAITVRNKGSSHRKRYVKDILQLHLSKRAIEKGSKSKKFRGSRIERDDNGITARQPSSGESIKDSQIKNRNTIILATLNVLDHNKPNLSPKAIWDFISQLGAMEEMDEEETIHCIEEMEERDAALYNGNRQKAGNGIDEVGKGHL